MSKPSEVLKNPNLICLRLSQQEKISYTNLYSNKGFVSRSDFPKLLGVFGTDIAVGFANRIFEVFSSDSINIALNDYLKYIDVYHYGDEIERCKVTCRLMDISNTGKISLKDFDQYINLIITAVKKVNPGLKYDLFSKEDIALLFNKISDNKEYFTYTEFENIYHEKPEILSWIDYFKNDSNDSLLFIHKYIKKIVKYLCGFTSEMAIILKHIRKNGGKDFNCEDVLNKLESKFDKFKSDIKNYDIKFMKFANYNKFNIKNIFEKIQKNNEDDYDHDKNSERENESIDKINKVTNSVNNINIINNSNNNLNINLNINNIINTSNNKESNHALNFNRKKTHQSIYEIETTKKEHKEIYNFFDSIKRKIGPEENDNNDKNTFEHRKNTLINNSSKLVLNLNEKNTNKNNLTNLTNLSQSVYPLQNQQNIKISQSKSQKQSHQEKNNKKINDAASDSDDFSFSSDEDDEGFLSNLHNLQMKSEIACSHSITGILERSKGISKINNSPLLKDINSVHPLIETDKKSSNVSIDSSSSMSQLNNPPQNRNISSSSFPIILKIFENIFYKIFKTLLNVDDCYTWIEKHYLKTPLKEIFRTKKIEKNQKDLMKKQSMSSSNQGNENNIPQKLKLKSSCDSFKILLNMIMGIQIAVQSTPEISEIHNMKQYLNSMTYSINTINFGIERQEIFFLKEFAGILFNNLRKIFGFTKEKFIQSISPQDFITEIMIRGRAIIEELTTTGSSGSFFYYTRDGKFILKTISHNEYRTIKRILPNYYQHFIKYPNSYLPKYLGCYKLLIKHKKSYKNIYFIIMMNIFDTTRKIHLRFDLKGSRIGRRVLDLNIKEKSIESLYDKYTVALKDMDLLKYNKKFYISRSLRDTIITQLVEDSNFLKLENLNDYSLLIGIHKINFINGVSNSLNKEFELKELNDIIKYNSNEGIDNNLNEDKDDDNILLTESDDEMNYEENSKLVDGIDKTSDGGVISENKDEIYYFGIIDILTEFNGKKNCEYCLKTTRYCSQGFSCLPPAKYQKRFVEFMRSNLTCKNLENEEGIGKDDEEDERKGMINEIENLDNMDEL